MSLTCLAAVRVVSNLKIAVFYVFEFASSLHWSFSAFPSCIFFSSLNIYCIVKLECLLFAINAFLYMSFKDLNTLLIWKIRTFTLTSTYHWKYFTSYNLKYDMNHITHNGNCHTLTMSFNAGRVWYREYFLSDFPYQLCPAIDRNRSCSLTELLNRMWFLTY